MQESTQLGFPFPLDRLTLPLKPKNSPGGCLEVLEAENGAWGNQIFKITRQKEPEAHPSLLGTSLPQTSGPPSHVHGPVFLTGPAPPPFVHYLFFGFKRFILAT